MEVIGSSDLTITCSTIYSQLMSGKERNYDSISISSRIIGQPIPREVCDAVFQQLHRQLRDSLDFHEIWPFLNSYQLLSSLDQSLFIDPTTTLDTKIDILVSGLPRCEREDYLSDFVNCLRESAGKSGAGKAHEELVEEIQRLCRKELKKDRKHQKVTPIQRELTPRSRDEQDYQHYGKNYLKKYSFWRQHSCVIRSITAFVLQSILFAIGIILFLIIIPGHLQHQAQFDVLGSSTIVLDKSIQSRWIQSVNLQWNFSDDNVHCKAEAVVIAGRDCSDMQIFLEHKAEEVVSDNLLDYSLPFYALPGSSLTVSLPDSDAVRHKHIWFTQTLDEYSIFSLPATDCRYIHYNCQDACYKTDNHINSTIVFNVSRPGYYWYFLSNDDNTCYVPPLTGGIRYFVNISTFNYTTISNYYKHSIQHEEITGNRKPTTIQVSRSFKFEEPSCPLLNFYCFDFLIPKYTLQLTSWKPRTDIVYVLFISYVVCICLDFLFLLLGFCIKQCMTLKK